MAAGLSATPWPGASLEGTAGAAGGRACFGAAARDPEKPCVNHKLDFTAIPRPRDAVLQPGAPCTIVRRRSPQVCAFGAAPSAVAPTVALLGDSHAEHWRAALAVVARREGWRGVSITRSRCPFSLAKKPPRPCFRWAYRVLQWLKEHPAVRIVFVSSDVDSAVSSPPRRVKATKIDGYQRAWTALPASVEEVFVFHDVPKANERLTSRCVERNVARHRKAGVRCARPRAVALRPDPEVAAAERFASELVKVIDLTPFMCDDRKCFPVVGGALVIKDVGHLTRTFSTTLGRFVQRAVSRLRAPA